MSNRLKYVALAAIFIASVVISYNLFSPPQRLKRVMPSKLGSIVRLVYQGQTFCTGTVIASNIILTAAHCVLQDTAIGPILISEPIEIRAGDNVPHKVYAMPAFASGQMDHALLLGDFKMFEVRKFISDPELINRYQRQYSLNLVSCGYPLNGNFYCSAMSYIRPIAFMWAVEGLLLPGMSGGPTMLPDGTVIGVNVAVEGEVSIISPIYNIPVQFKKETK